MRTIHNIFSRALPTLEKYSGLFTLLAFMTLYMLIRITLANRTSLTSIVVDLVAAYCIVFGIWYIRKKSRFTRSVLRYDFLSNMLPVYAMFFPYVLFFFGLLLHIHKMSFLVMCVITALYGERLVSLCIKNRIRKPKDIRKLFSGSNTIATLESLYAVILSGLALLLIVTK